MRNFLVIVNIPQTGTIEATRGEDFAVQAKAQGVDQAFVSDPLGDLLASAGIPQANAAWDLSRWRTPFSRSNKFPVRREGHSPNPPRGTIQAKANSLLFEIKDYKLTGTSNRQQIPIWRESEGTGVYWEAGRTLGGRVPEIQSAICHVGQVPPVRRK